MHCQWQWPFKGGKDQMFNAPAQMQTCWELILWSFGDESTALPTRPPRDTYSVQFQKHFDSHMHIFTEDIPKYSIIKLQVDWGLMMETLKGGRVVQWLDLRLRGPMFKSQSSLSSMVHYFRIFHANIWMIQDVFMNALGAHTFRVVVALLEELLTWHQKDVGSNPSISTSEQ